MLSSIALSVGDYNGIGPEIILKSLRDNDMARFLLFAPASVTQYYAELLDIPPIFTSVTSISEAVDPQKHYVITDGFSDVTPSPGKLSALSGEVAMRSIQFATKAVMKGAADALVTAPISKEAIQMAGYSEPGHTEFLAKITNCDRYTMMLVSDVLRVALLTTHIPVKAIASAVTIERILEKLEIVNVALKQSFGIHQPRIAVFGLNPHAGDGGVMGNEELEVITPAIERARELGINCEGPFPADGWFGNRLFTKFDAVLAMYHDQGLAPFKALSFGKGVNFTAGLPIIRTSPDHGTAFDIAGTGKASIESLIEAVGLAIRLSNEKRNK
jgi:4-phospho-D-threonate 3-dehydrogenase / 4-phospho-D-erythronate 3-dehydrogenase